MCSKGLKPTNNAEWCDAYNQAYIGGGITLELY